MGLTREARNAGTQPAVRPTAARTTTAATSVAGSLGSRPNNTQPALGNGWTQRVSVMLSSIGSDTDRGRRIWIAGWPEPSSLEA